MEQIFNQVSREGVTVLNYWTYLAERVCVYQFLFYHTKSDQLINSSCGLLPRAHGSALFTRSETQVCVNFSLSPNFMFRCCGTVFICSCRYEAQILQTRKSVGVILASDTSTPQTLYDVSQKYPTPIYLHIFKIILKDTFWILSNTSL
jgi:hypothetical protein